MNCHGAAIFAAGACPVITRLNHPAWEQHPNLCEIPFNELSTGNLVFFNSKTSGSHSFVYLENDICLSANGWNQPLRIYTLQQILESYPLASGLILSATNAKIFRKNTNYHISEKLADAIADFYEARTMSVWYLNDKSTDFKLLENLAGLIYKELHIEPGNSNEISKLIWKKITDILPCSMVRRLEATVSTTGLIAQQLGIQPTTTSQQNKESDSAHSVTPTASALPLSKSKKTFVFYDTHTVAEESGKLITKRF